MTRDPRLGRIVGHTDGTQVLLAGPVMPDGIIWLSTTGRCDKWHRGDPPPEGWRYLDEPAFPGRAATAADIDALRQHADWLMSLPVDGLDAAEARGYRYAASRLRTRADQMLRDAVEADR